MSVAPFLLNTRTPWEEPPRARHQVAEALAKRHRVYFVSQNRWGPPGLARREISETLTMIQPSWPVRKRIRYRTPGINELYQRWLFPRLREIVPDARVINFDHTATQLSRYFADSIYYCNDYHIRNYGIRPIRAYFERCERVVASRSRGCIATCEYLRRRLSAFNPNTREIRLGAPSAGPPPDFRGGGLPIRVALVDFTREAKTPVDLLEEIGSDARFTLHLYGPVETAVRERLNGAGNINFEGVVQGPALLSALGTMDAGIAIYRPDDGNPGRTPNKMWLYLAAGLPCVVTNIPAIRDWTFAEGFVYRVDDNQSFREMIVRAHEENGGELATDRYEYAQRNSWDRRVDDLLAMVNGTRPE